jgi:2'-hydroxyisoflavone reductase
MKLLILGGTQFVGRHLVQIALQQGHQVTLFNRGKTNADLFPAVEKLVGDRGLRGSTPDLSALHGRAWDAVIDVNGYVPRQVREAAAALRGNVGLYTFISTISVFAALETPHLDESSARAQWPEGADRTSEDITGETYGPLKVDCEAAIEAAMPSQALIVRPGLVVGPHDHTDRFTYWPVRFAQGGDILVPGTPPGRLLSVIDGRDLAEFTLQAVERGLTGDFNATCPPFPMQDLVRYCINAATAHGAQAQPVWVSDEFLSEHNVVPWGELPVYLPFDLTPNVGKGMSAGMTFRPLADTVTDTLAWDLARPAGSHKFTFTTEREQAILKAWRERQG